MSPEEMQNLVLKMKLGNLRWINNLEIRLQHKVSVIYANSIDVSDQSESETIVELFDYIIYWFLMERELVQLNTWLAV